MKKCFKLHPTQYAIRQNEEFYAEMAQKGWVLEKRGEYLSRFFRAEPQNTLYKVELSCQDPSGEDTAKLKGLYEGAGWTFVTRKGLQSIFSAPIDTALPEIRDNAARTAAVYKAMLKNTVAGFAVIALAVIGLVIAANRGLLLEIVLAWYTDTAKMLLAGTVLILLLFDTLCSAPHAAALLGKGEPFDGKRSGSGGFRRAVVRMLVTACAIFALQAGSQLLSTKEYNMPAQADGPYILLSELGWTGERTYSYQKDDVSAVTHVRSLLSEQWYTKEFVEERPDGAQCMLRQEIYRLQSPKEAMEIVPSVMSESVFARGEDGYTKVEVPGLDAAWQNDFECIAVKGSTVYYLICLDSATGTPAGPKADVLTVLAKYHP